MGQPDCIRERQEREVVTIVTASAFIARSSQRRISIATANAVTGISMSIRWGHQRRDEDWLCKSSNNMAFECTMIESIWQRGAVHNESIDGPGIARAPGLRMRRAADANS
jgi:hypothetical protein